MYNGLNPYAGGFGLSYLTQLPPGSFAAFDQMLAKMPLWSQARAIAGNPDTLKTMFLQIDRNAEQIVSLGTRYGIENGPEVLKDGVSALMKGFSAEGATGLMGALKTILAKTPSFLPFLESVSNLLPGLGLIVSLAMSLPALLDPHASAAQKTAALLNIAGGVVGLVPGGGVVGSALSIAALGVTVLQQPIDDMLTRVGTGMGMSINGYPPHMDFAKEANDLVAQFEREGNQFPSFRPQGARYGV